jgi:hypothetical protein
MFFCIPATGITGASAGSFSGVFRRLFTGYCGIATARGLVLTGLKVFFHLYYFLKVIVLFKVTNLMMLKSKIKLRNKQAYFYACFKQMFMLWSRGVMGWYDWKSRQ